MNLKYGINRVLEPQSVLPTSAWKLDNSRAIQEGELRIAISRLHLEATSFKQILQEANGAEEKIKTKIMDIIILRGKLHNPVTDTGGLVVGTIEEIGPEYDNKLGLKVGDQIVCNASLASIPMYINSIGQIDRAFNQIEVTGYAILHSKIPVIKVDNKSTVKLLMLLLDESGTISKLDSLINVQKRFLVVGNNLLTNLIYGYVIRRKLGSAMEIDCFLDKRSEVELVGEGMDRLIAKVFDEVISMDLLKPTDCVISRNIESYYDLSVNCAEIPGAETINILATRPAGTILFANLINNLNIVLYITESISKDQNIFSAIGFTEGYDGFDLQLVEELSEYFEDVEVKRIEREITDEVTEDPYNTSLLQNSMAEDFVYKSKPMQKVLKEIMKVSSYDCNVIIFGDTGVGKEKVANIIQKNSDRKMQPFVKINCGAISPNLIESEFFGYERGAFTGANATGKKGYFEIANNGVMFLDEIGELPLDMQAKLLRVIQDGEFYRVGGTKPVKTNVRIISATNRDLAEMVEEGTFRRDLFYRLNVVPIHIPKLSQRPEDVKPLVKNFIKIYSKKFGIKRGIEDSALDYLMKLEWPGNIRELENCIQRLIISAEGNDITLMDVIKEVHGDDFESNSAGKGNDVDIDFGLATGEYEANLIKHALETCGSTRKAAASLGMSQSQLMRKKKKYGI